MLVLKVQVLLELVSDLNHKSCDTGVLVFNLSIMLRTKSIVGLMVQFWNRDLTIIIALV